MKVGLIGYPLGHSFSAGWFARKFADTGEQGEYTPYPLPHAGDIGSFLSRHSDLAGFNVTIPYKRVIIDYLDEITPDAARIGAVNVVARSWTDGGVRLVGYNTDWLGFRDSVAPLLSAQTRRALVLGTGGAARAVSHALHSLGVDVTFVSRTPEKSELKPAISVGDIDAETVRTHLLIVNATPVGTFPDIGSAPPFPYELLSPRHICHDLVYNPGVTEFMRLAAARGASVKNGLHMLTRQAELSYEIWKQSP